MSLSVLNKNSLPLQLTQEESPIPWHNPLYLLSGWLHILPYIVSEHILFPTLTQSHLLPLVLFHFYSTNILLTKLKFHVMLDVDVTK